MPIGKAHMPLLPFQFQPSGFVCDRKNVIVPPENALQRLDFGALGLEHYHQLPFDLHFLKHVSCPPLDN